MKIISISDWYRKFNIITKDIEENHVAYIVTRYGRKVFKVIPVRNGVKMLQ